MAILVAPMRSAHGEPVSEEKFGTDPMSRRRGCERRSLMALRRQGAERLKAGQFAEAADLLERARAIEPGDCKRGSTLAWRCKGQTDTEALQHFSDLQKERPDLPAHFCTRRYRCWPLANRRSVRRRQ